MCFSSSMHPCTDPHLLDSPSVLFFNQPIINSFDGSASIMRPSSRSPSQPFSPSPRRGGEPQALVLLLSTDLAKDTVPYASLCTGLALPPFSPSLESNPLAASTAIGSKPIRINWSYSLGWLAYTLHSWSADSYWSCPAWVPSLWLPHHLAEHRVIIMRTNELVSNEGRAYEKAPWSHVS